MTQVECCICRDWKDKEKCKWYTPSREQRQEYFFRERKKISHGYCPECYLITLKDEGCSPEEISELVRRVEEFKV